MNIKKTLWYAAGMFCVGMAYIGFVTPGIPFSIFLVTAAYCFSKSSKRMHDWLYNHPWFGKFLTEWTHNKVFPTRAKYAMVIVMVSTVAITYHATANLNAVLWSGGFMILVACWAWRFPGSMEEHDRRKAAGEKIGWIK